MRSLKALIVILSLIDLGTSLPVTSKPIENTPEHLAWEAWIMIPPTQNKTRKITPKSIFILPNKTTAPQINCPPGHVVENSKCIQTLQIDPNTILLNHLANVLNNTSYDFDYDYEEYEEPHKLLADTSNKVPDYNEGPLKIDLFDPSALDSNRDTFDFTSSTEDDVNPRPFRNQETPSTATTTTSTAKTDFEYDYELPDFFTQSSTNSATARTTTSNRPTTTTASTTTSPTTTITSTTTTTALPTTTTAPVSGSPSTTTPNRPTLVSSESLPITGLSFPSSLASVSTDASYSSTPLISSQPDDINFTSKDSDYGEDYGITVEDGDEETTAQSEEGEEITAASDFTSPDVQDDYVKSSMNLHATHQSTTQDKRQDDAIIFRDEISSIRQTANTHPDSKSAITSPTSPLNLISENANNDAINTSPELPPNRKLPETTVPVKDNEPLLDSIENNNRFVYHHLGSAITSSKKPQRSDGSTTSEVQDQLRIINKIVEENKKRSDPSISEIRFPSDTFIQTDNVKADFIRFPGPTSSRVSIPTAPSQSFTDTRVIPILRQPTIFSPTTSMRAPLLSAPVVPTAPTERHHNTKPYWWLPSGWEIDTNGDKPFLLRFWSRASPTPTISSSLSAAASTVSDPSTTVNFRENSRQPTDNLYREINAQEFYKVLGARNSRHHNTNEFT